VPCTSQTMSQTKLATAAAYDIGAGRPHAPSLTVMHLR
jgi:hypothetical protein